MKHTVSTEYLPEKEFLVIRGYGKLYGLEVTPAPEPGGGTWDIIKRQLNDGSIERLKEAACSNTVYLLFCNTCVHNDEEKCYVCSYDIACENLNKSDVISGLEIVRLNPCEYAVFDCEFDCETTLQDAHEKPDALFWGEWLKENPYVSAIDDPANWKANGFASIELYSPFDPDAERFNVKIWYPIIKKENPIYDRTA